MGIQRTIFGLTVLVMLTGCLSREEIAANKFGRLIDKYPELVETRVDTVVEIHEVPGDTVVLDSVVTGYSEAQMDSVMDVAEVLVRAIAEECDSALASRIGRVVGDIRDNRPRVKPMRVESETAIGELVIGEDGQWQLKCICKEKKIVDTDVKSTTNVNVPERGRRSFFGRVRAWLWDALACLGIFFLLKILLTQTLKRLSG